MVFPMLDLEGMWLLICGLFSHVSVSRYQCDVVCRIKLLAKMDSKTVNRTEL